MFSLAKGKYKGPLRPIQKVVPIVVVVISAFPFIRLYHCLPIPFSCPSLYSRLTKRQEEARAARWVASYQPSSDSDPDLHILVLNLHCPMCDPKSFYNNLGPQRKYLSPET